MLMSHGARTTTHSFLLRHFTAELMLSLQNRYILCVCALSADIYSREYIGCAHDSAVLAILIVNAFFALFRALASADTVQPFILLLFGLVFDIHFY